MNRLVKSILYRIFASGLTFSIAYVFTENAAVSVGISIFEFIGKVIVYWIYDYAWDRISKYFQKQSPKCYWFTGLNSAGKTTVAKSLVSMLPKNTIHLDGDSIRNSINYDLGFSKNDISKNIDKIAKLSKLLMDQDFTVVVSCISKYASDRKHARSIIGDKSYCEVYVTCDTEELISRQSILHKNTPIIQTDYEITTDYQHLTIDTTTSPPDKCAKEILKNAH